jgi:hypothetical protein
LESFRPIAVSQHCPPSGRQLMQDLDNRTHRYLLRMKPLTVSAKYMVRLEAIDT